ncbi:hypothetical protein QCD60_12010 [Pokkaliibacter sp. MBI-7]|uniref:hypothetical protein n=1 Tax=Pokkaliibacter sp. MBI-7 TaxID=3040600 RepID=UPI00244835F8|nr:hypothetical protein [Pokkaliibacter sp. MBI-7]MDH2433294.1 hypothetical protein [Pokkaliibacter sp. MBI-7]
MKRVWLAPFSLMMLALGGCQQWSEQNLKTAVPRADTYPYSTQQKMETAHHWDVLAKDMAERIAQSLPDHQVAIYVEPPATATTFSTAFHSLLQSQMVKQGLHVTLEPGLGAVHTRYTAQLIQHKDLDGARPVPGTYTVLATGLAVMRNAVKNSWENSYLALPLVGLGADYGAGRTVSNEGMEVLITTEVVYGSNLLMSESNMYYINAGGKDHYVASDSAWQGKTIQVVGQ